MKVPYNKKLIELYCYVGSNECLPLLDFLKEKLPKDIPLEDVVLTSHYIPSDDGGQESRGHTELNIGYLMSKEVYDERKRQEKISEERRNVKERSS